LLAWCALSEKDRRSLATPEPKDAAMNDAKDVGGGVVTSYKNAPTRTFTAGRVAFACRDLGPRSGVPVVFITHLAAVLDS
jgi:hypothetical protein